ncbi:translation initiation factor IF-2-like [Psammomys obesus]|uniref:translation initiation factor IF-2-like n=1 Tax=Psammomys obesus TaxID=48139 RepID=UPI002453524E|nr:translation initiation factor IF-2-like [Psammomys obesus]
MADYIHIHTGEQAEQFYLDRGRLGIHSFTGTDKIRSPVQSVIRVDPGDPRRPSSLSTSLLSNHPRRLHTRSEQCRSAGRSAFRAPGERGRRRTQESGRGAERRAAVGGAASAGSSRASPVAGSEHSPAEEAARRPRTSAPSPAGRGKAAGGAEPGTPLNLSRGAGASGGAVRPRAVAQPACVPGGDPGCRICPFAPRRLRLCACPEPVRSLGGSGARRPGGTLSPTRSTDPPPRRGSEGRRQRAALIPAITAWKAMVRGSWTSMPSPRSAPLRTQHLLSR